MPGTAQQTISSNPKPSFHFQFRIIDVQNPKCLSIMNRYFILLGGILEPLCDWIDRYTFSKTLMGGVEANLIEREPIVSRWFTLAPACPNPAAYMLVLRQSIHNAICIGPSNRKSDCHEHER